MASRHVLQVLELADDDDEELDDELEELIYGEFSLPLFCALMEELKPSSDATLLDIGSGRGQLVLAAAKGPSSGIYACFGTSLLQDCFICELIGDDLKCTVSFVHLGASS